VNYGDEKYERIQSLRVDQATVGLDAKQRSELDTLMGPDHDIEQDAFMRTAALVQLGIHSISTRGQGAERMPAELRRRLMGKAMQGGAEARSGTNVVSLVDRQPPTRIAEADRPEQRQQSNWPMAGWATAAGLLLALLIAVQEEPIEPVTESRSELALEGDMVRMPWAPSGEAVYANVTGDVVWSDTRQEGYMLLNGLQPNNPQLEQYQLWIIDPDRGPQPVDGGVFDVPAGSDEVVVAVNAKLRVDKPVAFAITLEQPGGVVVSEGPLLIVTES